MNKLGDFIRVERLRRSLSLGELARLVGYRNINKGVRRITSLERTGITKPDLLVNIAEALKVDWMMVESLAEEDHQERQREWEAWANEPVPSFLVVRLMAAVYARKSLPEGITTPEQAVAWACEFAREHRWRVCLVVSRRLSVWIDALGLVQARAETKPGVPNIPFMEIGGRRFLLE